MDSLSNLDTIACSPVRSLPVYLVIFIDGAKEASSPFFPLERNRCMIPDEYVF